MSEKNEKKIPEEKKEPEEKLQEPAKAKEVPAKKPAEQPSNAEDKTPSAQAKPVTEKAPKADDAKENDAPAKLARPKECVVCSKNIQKLWYYRNGKFYCGKGCWKKSKKEKESPEKKK